jgi:hypothetical protein
MIVGVIVFLFFFIIIVSLLRSCSSSFAPPPTTAPVTTTQPASTTIHTGDNVTLDDGGSSGITLVAATKADLDALIQSSIANDTIGFHQMLAAGRVWAVDDGTKALVLATGMFSTQVRILSTSSPSYGMSGWVPFESCKK